MIPSVQICTEHYGWTCVLFTIQRPCFTAETDLIHLLLMKIVKNHMMIQFKTSSYRKDP